MALDEVFAQTNSSEKGISPKDATHRLAQYGQNTLPEEKSDSLLKLFIRQFKSPLMYIMMLATLVSFLVGNNVEGFFIIFVMISNVLVGFYQEYKVDKSLQSLKEVIKPQARVIRSGREYEIEAINIVIGDVIALRPGDKIPADARILECKGLKVNEASLTGEAKAVDKMVGEVKPDVEVADRTNMVFMGTTVEEGSAIAITVATGAHTEFGDIVSLLKKTAEEMTPLQKMVISLSKFIGIFITIVVAVVIAIGFFSGYDFETIFESALALFVSAIPEGLLPGITIVLVLGVRHILKRNGLVRRIAATETLGGVTVICTDKTGTLTEGKMEVHSLITTDGVHVCEPHTYDQLSERATALIHATVLATDAYVENPSAKKEDLIVRGSMTEQSLIRMAVAAQMDTYAMREREPILDHILFSSDRKYSANLRTSKEGNVVYVLGAPERILNHTTHVLTSTGAVSASNAAYKKLLAEKDKFVAMGYRVVACASKSIDHTVQTGELEAEMSDLTLIGFIAISDPVRADVPAAFKDTKKAGIRTIIVTGDHALTAQAVAEQIGFTIPADKIIEGHDIESMTDATLRKKIKTIVLCARVSPRHKLRIVQALQYNGEVVAMFGDGANDAPALKAADIGVAVQTKISAVREVADLVLLDGGFGTIIKAIEQGRIIFNNIRKVFLYLITQDFSQFFIFIMSILLGLPLPILAVQLLLVNLIESGLPDLSLTTEQEKEGIMDEPPRDPKESILNKSSRYWMAALFITSSSIAMILYISLLRTGIHIDHVRTMMTVFLCLESLFLVFSVRSFTRSIFRKSIFENKFITWAVVISFVMILAAVYLPSLQKVLNTVSLSFHDWLLIATLNLCEVAIIDQFKRYFFQKPKKIKGERQVLQS